jgi:hypothetical protein
MVWKRKPDGERRDRFLRIRVNDEEALIIEEHAAVAGLSVSEYVRQVATKPGRFRFPDSAQEGK